MSLASAAWHEHELRLHCVIARDVLDTMVTP